MAWVRSAGLRGVRAVIEELGGDADAIARRAGAPGGALDDDELLVQASTIAAILETAARDLRCADFGLRVALRQDLGMLGPLAVALQNSPTVADALAATSKYLFVHARGLSVAVIPDPRGNRGVIGIRYGHLDGARASPQSTEMGLLFLHRAIGYLVGGSYGLRTVELPHLAVGQRGRYEDLFGARTNFGQPAAILRTPRDIPGRSIAGGDQVTRHLALSYLAQQSVLLDQHPVSGRVRALLLQSLGTGPTSLGTVAALLAMSVRTLQRHLNGEQTSFATVLDEVRRDRAWVLLRDSDLPVNQIASAVGLSDAASLSRYSRRWWGTTPREVRRQRLAPPALP